MKLFEILGQFIYSIGVLQAYRFFKKPAVVPKASSRVVMSQREWEGF